MNIEQTDALTRRAARHAALSDPARLRIVDALSLGDASPTELQAMLAMPSNLLAHHLNVLQTQGLVVRARSEADRRRTYLRLEPAALDGLLPGATGAASRIVFVCTANSARSQLAAALWRRASAIPSASAGTHLGPRVDPGAIDVAQRHGLALRRARPRALRDVLAPDDVVITVCDRAHEELGDLGGIHWSIPDPVRLGTQAAFDAAFDDISRRVSDVATRLVTDHHRAPELPPSVARTLASASDRSAAAATAAASRASAASATNSRP